MLKCFYTSFTSYYNALLLYSIGAYLFIQNYINKWNYKYYQYPWQLFSYIFIFIKKCIFYLIWKYNIIEHIIWILYKMCFNHYVLVTNNNITERVTGFNGSRMAATSDAFWSGRRADYSTWRIFFWFTGSIEL